MNHDGTMSRLPDLVRFCKLHNLLMVTVADLARYRMEAEYEGSSITELLTMGGMTVMGETCRCFEPS
jgi:3,4-dihydroxy 2-butanone 4-phosphate synthase/GTP cyclohydrolase II